CKTFFLDYFRVPRVLLCSPRNRSVPWLLRLLIYVELGPPNASYHLVKWHYRVILTLKVHSNPLLNHPTHPRWSRLGLHFLVLWPHALKVECRLTLTTLAQHWLRLVFHRFQ